MGHEISAMRTNQLARHLLQYEKIQLISTKFEKKISADGFDRMRAFWTTISILFETIIPLISDTKLKLFGSIGEGIFYPVDYKYEKDIDFVTILGNYVAVENDHDVIQDYYRLVICLIENDQSLPGYCYLRVKNDLSEFSLSPFPQKFYVSGPALKDAMQNSMFKIIWSQILGGCQEVFNYWHVEQPYQQGPAIHYRVNSKHLTPGLCKSDTVVLIACPKWPSCASKWITRRRPYDWPTETIIAEIVAKGIYLAPVGCKIHPRRDLQWRYSFNEAERRLVRSFNTAQAKCYTLLKRVISENVKPHFEGEDVISSYHLKTLMFWTIEETDPQVWVPSNLIGCVFLVLNRLARCVDNENCPSYFMPEENLFLLKVTPENKDELLTCISSFMREGWQVLMRLSNFAFDQYFVRYIHQEYDTQIYPLAAIVSDRLGLEVIGALVFPMVLASLDVFEIKESDKIRSKVTDIIKHLMCHANDCGDERAKEVIKNIIANVCSSYGTICLSRSRCQTVESSQRAELDDLGYKYIKLSCLRKQVECLAKYANYEYVRGNLQSVIYTADNILPMYFNRLGLAPILSTRVLYHLQLQMTQYQDISFFYDSEKCEFIDNIQVQRELTFTKNEIYAVPGNAKVEMSMDKQVRGPIDPVIRFKQCLVVDPYLYVTYLSFLTYSDLGYQEEEDKAITRMEIICSMSPYCYQPTSLNLLGDCYLKRGKLEKALQTFAVSMQRNNNRNAAPWHVARLLWRKLSDRWSQTLDVNY